MPTDPLPAHLGALPSQIDQSKMEYDRLIAYFKLLVWITGALFALVITAAGILLFKSTSDIQTQLTATREAATQQISSIATTAQATAKAEAQKAIDTAFEKQNIQRMIETTAQKKVDAAVDEAVRKNLGARIDDFRSLVHKIGEIANQGAELRMEFRSGLDALNKETQDPDSTVRAYARSTLTEIASDYERIATDRITAFSAGNANYVAVPFAKTPKALMEVIRHLNGPLAPDTVALAFLDMKKRLGWDVPMFDIPAAEKWCAEHKPKCDE